MKDQLISGKKVLLPSVIIPTAGKGIIVSDTIKVGIQNENALGCADSFEPNVFIIKDEKDERIALVIRLDADMNEAIIQDLKDKGYNVVQQDISWAKKGVTSDEMGYLLEQDVTKKKWVYHKLIEDGENRLLDISEPIESSGGGLAHQYYACPLNEKACKTLIVGIVIIALQRREYLISIVSANRALKHIKTFWKSNT